MILKLGGGSTLHQIMHTCYAIETGAPARPTQPATGKTDAIAHPRAIAVFALSTVVHGCADPGDACKTCALTPSHVDDVTRNRHCHPYAGLSRH